MSENLAVEMKGIVKRFGAVTANERVDFSARAGEVHALLGENGAGKSTVMSLLSGVYRPNEGDIFVRGTNVSIRSPKDAAALGIGMVYQNFRLVQTLTATDNIVLGEKGFWRGRRWLREKQEEIAALSERFGLLFPVDRPIWQLSVGEQQRVEIVKTLYREASIVILDEPTSVLTPGEAEQLFATLSRMKAEGKTVILTTHKLNEVMAAADRISVMRKGRMIASGIEASSTDERALAQLMIGREVAIRRQERPKAAEGAKTLLEIERLEVTTEQGRSALQQLSLTVREGEIVGVAGVAGNGQKELAETIAGLLPWKSGAIRFDGRAWKSASVRGAIQAGISHVPEHRMKSGLAGSLGAVDNLLFKSYRKPERSAFGFLRAKRNRAWAEALVKRFDVVAPGLDAPVAQLSGGNQQKLLFAREVTHEPKLMVAVHPTQGLDVGATEGVHKLLMELRAGGSGVLLISEDLDEIMHLSDRILVIYNGQFIGETTHEAADLERIGLWMAGVRESKEAAG